MVFIGMLMSCVCDIFYKKGPKYILNLTILIQITGLIIILHPDEIVKYFGAIVLGIGYAGFQNYSKMVLMAVSSQKLISF